MTSAPMSTIQSKIRTLTNVSQEVRNKEGEADAIVGCGMEKYVGGQEKDGHCYRTLLSQCVPLFLLSNC